MCEIKDFYKAMQSWSELRLFKTFAIFWTTLYLVLLLISIIHYIEFFLYENITYFAFDFFACVFIGNQSLHFYHEVIIKVQYPRRAASICRFLILQWAGNIWSWKEVAWVGDQAVSVGVLQESAIATNAPWTLKLARTECCITTLVVPSTAYAKQEVMLKFYL